MVAARLFLRSAARDEWVSCPLDEITWLDRSTLSGNEDLTLHRAPRCAGLRYVHHRWELFSRDPTYQVFLAPDAAGTAPPADVVQQAARHVLPAAAANYEARPVVLEGGLWLVSVAGWVLRLRLDMPPAAGQLDPGEDQGAITREGDIIRRGGSAGAEAVARVRAYFERNTTARLAMAYYYQEYILGVAAPQAVPMTNVVIALNLSGEGAVSDYKKLLQGMIWSERGHARDLAGFLLANGLLTPADLDEARETAASNERNGVCEMARQRLRYRPKGRDLSAAIARLRRRAIDVRIHAGIVERASQDGHPDRTGTAAANRTLVIAALGGGEAADDQPDNEQRRSEVHGYPLSADANPRLRQSVPIRDWKWRSRNLEVPGSQGRIPGSQDRAEAPRPFLGKWV